MGRVLFGTGTDYEICRVRDSRAQDCVRDATPPGLFLRRLITNRQNIETLRSVLLEEMGSLPNGMSTQSIVDRIADRIADGRLLIVRRTFGDARRLAAGESEGQVETESESSSVENWISFRVLWDDTGEPVASVELEITDPSFEMAPYTTNSDGLIEIKSVPSGRYEAAGAMESLEFENTLDFVGLGAVLDPKPDTPHPYSEDLPSGPFFVRRVTAHRVRSGETIESVAEDFGLTWQDIANFNFGTTARSDVDKHLRYQIGCTKTDEAGAIVFDDADEPGVILVPKEWKRPGCSTGHTHDLRVRRLRRNGILRLEDPFLGVLGECSAELTYADGSQESATSDARGIVEVALDRWSDDGNFVDLKFNSGIRDHELRVFLVCEHSDTVNGAWQRLVNLGYVHTMEKPKAAPEHDSVFAAALEVFQSLMGIRPDGELDRATSARLRSVHANQSLWVDSLSKSGTAVVHEGRAKDEVA